MNTGKQTGGTRRMAGLAIFTAIIVVLQVLCTFIRFGPFSITLALAPIIIGTAMYGKGAGAYLGDVFGAVVLITGLLGWDGGTVMLLMGINPVGCILICLVKGIAAGFFAGLCYELLAKKNDKVGVLVSGIVCPVVNTGLFIVGMLVFFFDTLSGWAGGQDLLLYIIVGLTGINFLVELAVNIILSSGITQIIRAGKKMH
ncbi:MAG: ECF transporter S component [Oscillospiraceae bacterium]|nr:ECF transporter S component [Oscillospiraceae bacterium]